MAFKREALFLFREDLKEVCKNKLFRDIEMEDFKMDGESIIRAFQIHDMAVFNDDNCKTKILKNRYGSMGAVVNGTL